MCAGDKEGFEENRYVSDNLKVDVADEGGIR